MQDNVRFDRWWARIVGAFVIVFLGWFLLQEWRGLVPLAEFIVGAIIAIPDAIGNIITYYGTVSPIPLLISLLIGAAFGVLMTTYVYLVRRGYITPPRLMAASVWMAFIAGAFAVLNSASIGLVLLSFAGVLIVVNIIRDKQTRDLFSGQTLKTLTTPIARSLVLRGVILGAVVGAIGAQVLNAPLQHCTFEPEADAMTRWMGYGLTIISAFILLVPMWALTLRGKNRRTSSQAGYFRGRGLPLLLLAPTLLSLLVFLYYPTFQIAAQSLLRVRRGRNVEPVFDCLSNYVSLLNNNVYQTSFFTTVTVTVAIVIFSMTIALLVALLAAQKVRGASIYRTLLIWPYALSPVVTAAIFISMFRDDRSGLINHILYTLGVDTVRWITDASVAPWVLIGAAVYNILGFNIIFYVAGLQNVPKDLLEAAQIDGANIFQRFLRITIPLLSPYTFFLLVANITYSFYGIYGVIDTLFPGGGPLLADGQSRAANVLIYKVYEDSFRSGATQLGDVAAQSMILFLLVASITLLQFRYIESRVTYAD